jgi:hypothetical protein
LKVVELVEVWSWAEAGRMKVETEHGKILFEER